MTIGSLPPDRPPDDSGQGQRPGRSIRTTEGTEKRLNQAGEARARHPEFAADRLELTQNQIGTADKETRVTYGLNDFSRPSGMERQLAAKRQAAAADYGDRLEIIRERLEAGFYDRPDVIEVIAAKIADQLIQETEDKKDA